MEHIAEILEHGASDISMEERITYFDIVEEAQEIGIVLENVSIFKLRLDEIKTEGIHNPDTTCIQPLVINSDTSKHLQESDRETQNYELKNWTEEGILHDEVNNSETLNREDETKSTKCKEKRTVLVIHNYLQISNQNMLLILITQMIRCEPSAIGDSFWHCYELKWN